MVGTKTALVTRSRSSRSRTAAASNSLTRMVGAPLPDPQERPPDAADVEHGQRGEADRLPVEAPQRRGVHGRREVAMRGEHALRHAGGPRRVHLQDGVAGCSRGRPGPREDVRQASARIRRRSRRPGGPVRRRWRARRRPSCGPAPRAGAARRRLGGWRRAPAGAGASSGAPPPRRSWPPRTAARRPPGRCGRGGRHAPRARHPRRAGPGPVGWSARRARRRSASASRA